ncbi:MAG TPA: ice-binding family protein, partial [Anaerolineales bacterium]|nr:ice-binding family protein [Anaerolineales bacterium]
MNINKHKLLVTLALAFALVLSLMGGGVQAAPSAASSTGQGPASDFAVLAGTAVTCTDSTVTGNVGVYPGTAITQTNCTITGSVHSADGVAKQAYEAFLAEYDRIAEIECDEVLTGTLAGVTLEPGVYCFDAAATLTG